MIFVDEDGMQGIIGVRGGWGSNGEGIRPACVEPLTALFTHFKIEMRT